ncbi:Rho GTPase activation protein [Coprinopsis sp. MPI-PUGE-AT-0042]|nr:Rho GTPase activation protein [Coprinopsis sp. MPI-PUGE-AT-0042]
MRTLPRLWQERLAGSTEISFEAGVLGEMMGDDVLEIDIRSSSAGDEDRRGRIDDGWGGTYNDKVFFSSDTQMAKLFRRVKFEVDEESLQDRGKRTFGVDLAEQMMRDEVEVPPVVVKCCEAIEKYGIRSRDIYRLDDMSRKTTILKQRLDEGADSVDLDAAPWSHDIDTVASVLRLWLRELPEPLLTFHLYQEFINAAGIDIERLRYIRLHERVNDLPDPNYSTLKYLLGHLHRVSQRVGENAMSTRKLGIVFGGPLFGPQLSSSFGHREIAHPVAQILAVETMLNHYTDIFVFESKS